MLINLGEQKRTAAASLIANYSSDHISAEEIQRVLDSIADNNSYLSFNVKPVESALLLLRTHFDANLPPNDKNFSLELRRKAPGRRLFSSIYGYSSKYFGSGALLSHDHKTQYTFVYQSLSLWREIMASMPTLWLMADIDMLVECYRLADTGQGYQRIQSCPRVSGEMRRILRHVQSTITGQWVGLSVVHLGDRDVPNALVFIDK
ncbi:unnamed protein product, partial [Symbiodinium microadriaticum]